MNRINILPCAARKEFLQNAIVGQKDNCNIKIFYEQSNKDFPKKYFQGLSRILPTNITQDIPRISKDISRPLQNFQNYFPGHSQNSKNNSQGLPKIPKNISRAFMKFPKKISHKFKEYFQGLPRTTQFLELVLAALPEWVAALQPLPAVTWPAFIGNGDYCGGGDNGDGDGEEDGESCLLLLTLFGCFLVKKNQRHQIRG